MKKYLLILLIALGLATQAQILNSHYQYQLNWLNINPAYTGNTEGLTAILNPSTQWVGIAENPTNTMIGLHGNLTDNMGLGGKMVVDKRGIFSTITAEALYAYKVSLTESQKVSFGLSAGIYSSALDKSSLQNDQYTDLSDPSLGSDYYNESQFLLSFGVLYKVKKLEVGVSLPHMFVSGSSISEHVFATAKYDFASADNNLIVSPLLVYQHLGNSPDMMDAGAKLELKQLVWLQVSYRTNQSMSYALGLKLKGMNIGYLYNSSFSPVNDITKGAHEIFVSYTFKKSNKRKKETTPTLAAGTADRLNSLISEIENISGTANNATDAELSSIQAELSEILKKLENSSLTPEDDKKLEEIDARLQKLKKTL